MYTTVSFALEMAESFKLPTLDCWVSLALFTDVSNAGKLRSDATSGDVKATLLDTTLVSAHPRVANVSTVYVGDRRLHVVLFMQIAKGAC